MLKTKKSRLIIYISVILFLILFIFYKNAILIDENKGRINNNLSTIHTSFTEKESLISIYNTKGETTEIKINDIGLDNIDYVDGNFLLSSRYSGNYYILHKGGEIEKKEIPSNRGVTNLFTGDKNLFLLTNGGLKEKNGITYYLSGLFVFDKNSSYEYNYEKGFFTSGIYHNGFCYVLTFDPSIEKEIILKINNEGKVIKEFILGNNPRHGFNSMTVFKNNIYVLSDDGVMTKIDSQDNVQNFNINSDRSRVFSIHSNEDEIIVIYYSGLVSKIYEPNNIKKINLDFISKERLIFLQSEIRGDYIYILNTFEEKNVKDNSKYDGVVHIYSLKNGSIKDSIYLQKKSGLRLVNFKMID